MEQLKGDLQHIRTLLERGLTHYAQGIILNILLPSSREVYKTKKKQHRNTNKHIRILIEGLGQQCAHTHRTLI